ncbi:MAG: hypothetical protein EOO22_03800, partial [Comamonadaceae bacterium]
QAALRAGLSNVEFRAMDMSAIDPSFGRFDYVICHGVYSWVPPSVQDAILRVCSDNLSEKGLAYVSYNTYPGWKAREIVRDAMMLRAGPRDSPSEKLSYARGMLEFLDQSAKWGSVLKTALEETMPIILSANESYLLHDFLEPFNNPCYLKDFVARAQRAGLGYLADADPATMFVQNYGDAVREPLMAECGGSQVLLEQYLDFLNNRAFRQTLLLHTGRASQIQYRLDPQQLSKVSFAGTFRCPDQSAIHLGEEEQVCVGVRGRQVTLKTPVHKAVAQLLDAAYPVEMPPHRLVPEVAARLGQDGAAVAPAVMELLEALFIGGAVRVRLSPVDSARELTGMPRALASVRTLLELPLSAGAVATATNQWHELVGLTPVERCLLPLLDGTRDVEQLVQALCVKARADEIQFLRDEQPLADAQELEPFARQQIEAALTDLFKKGLLVA